MLECIHAYTGREGSQATLWLLTFTYTAEIRLVCQSMTNHFGPSQISPIQKGVAIEYVVCRVDLCEHDLSEDAHNPVWL